LVHSSNELPSSEAEDRAEKIRRSHNWIIKARDLSTRLFQALSKTVDSCERFCRQDVNYFRIPSTSDNTYEPLNSLPAIQITFDDLFKKKQTLKFTTGRCEQFAKDVSRDSEGLIYIILRSHLASLLTKYISLSFNSNSETMN
jgi:hypothetical protein